jgi:hypothetical protein
MSVKVWKQSRVDPLFPGNADLPIGGLPCANQKIGVPGFASFTSADSILRENVRLIAAQNSYEIHKHFKHLIK